MEMIFNRDIVFNAMCLFHGININNLSYDEKLELEGNLTRNTMNHYIISSYTGTINLKTILSEQFIFFLKFIDQYPTIYCSIKIIENQIIQYINKNRIKYCDYLKYLCKKYQLKAMYLDMHNKIIDEKDKCNKKIELLRLCL